MIHCYVIFGDLARRFRLERNLTQKDVSELHGGSPQHTTISRWEKGQALPRHFTDVERLSEVLSCTWAQRQRLYKAYERAVKCRRGLEDQAA